MKGEGKDFRCIMIDYSEYNHNCDYTTKNGASQSPYECTIIKGGTAVADSLGKTISTRYGDEWWVIKSDGTLQDYGKGNNNYQAAVTAALAATPSTQSAPSTPAGAQNAGGDSAELEEPQGMGTATLVSGVIFAICACVQCVVGVGYYVQMYKPFGPSGEETQGAATGLSDLDGNK